MEKYFKISEFAALSGLSRRQLLFYDQEDILHPAVVDPATGYRYYKFSQLEATYIIARLRDAQLPLDDIRDYMKEQSPVRLIEMLDRQERKLDRIIEGIWCAKLIIQSRRKRAAQGMTAEPDTIKLVRLAEEKLFLWPGFPESGRYQRQMPWNYIPEFYTACQFHGIPTGLPLGIYVDFERIKNHDWKSASGFFCHAPDQQSFVCYSRPAGTYAVCTSYIGQNFPEAMYEKLFSYIGDSNLKICGHSYEEHLLHSMTGGMPHIVQVIAQVTPADRPECGTKNGGTAEPVKNE